MKGRGDDPEAHRLYLQARHLIDRRTRDDVTKAIEYLQQALALEPEFALAWAELGLAYSREADFGWTPVAEGYERARAAAERALALEPDLAEAHTLLGKIRMKFEWDFRGAEASFDRALEIAPGNVSTLRWVGILALAVGHPEEAIAHHRKGLTLDPLSAACYSSLGQALHVVGRFAEAEAAYRKALELSPQDGIHRAELSMTLLAQDRKEEALEAALQEPDQSFGLWALALVHRALGQGPESDAALRRLIETEPDSSGFQIAEIYADRGEIDTAFAWLDRAYAARDTGLSDIMRTSPLLRSLHADPRWGQLLKRIGA